MQENFIIKGVNLHGSYYIPKIILISLIISFIMVYPILGFSNIQSILTFLLLFMIIYVILISLSNENLSNELPSSLYPSLPHTGLDGISLNNYVAGMDVPNYII